MTDGMKKDQKKRNVESAIIQGGFTKYIQAPDVHWCKPFRAMMTELYDQWLIESAHQFTGGEDTKFPSRKRIIEQVLEAQSQMLKKNILKSFNCCGLNLANDGTKDDFIHW